MRHTVAFLDASVLYPAPLRDLLLELAVSDLYRAKWSAAVHEEWIRALLRSRSDLTRDRLERTRDLMDAHTRDALVSGYEHLIETLVLPDPNDRHILAAAIKGKADIIVTANLKDFPADPLQAWGIVAHHPDLFLTQQFRRSQSAFLGALQTVRLRLRNPSKSAQEYLDTLRAQGLAATVDAIQPFSSLI
ncbi:PIN domain-containing protein [Aquibaculum arenosum]|uniref:PIN domain-containing protein n=1 Tax=Aquibaculum arenosum TaxID=3032591 RepID=A0ABT5YQJ9_9PROT|nr:PIN domain-containing protein [Fodinicurvata sp. CAU 1616]MDF2097169.1 PIN domain-containing protein [Fodinicurvata sp. CAU 1616]